MRQEVMPSFGLDHSEQWTYRAQVVPPLQSTFIGMTCALHGLLANSIPARSVVVGGENDCTVAWVGPWRETYLSGKGNTNITAQTHQFGVYPSLAARQN